MKNKLYLLFYHNGVLTQTNGYSLFSDLLDCYKRESTKIDSIFDYIKNSEELRERFLKANLITNE